MIFAFGVLDHVVSELFGKFLPENMPRTIAVGAIAMAVHPTKQRLERVVDAMLKRILALDH